MFEFRKICLCFVSIFLFLFCSLFAFYFFFILPILSLFFSFFWNSKFSNFLRNFICIQKFIKNYELHKCVPIIKMCGFFLLCHKQFKIEKIFPFVKKWLYFLEKSIFRKMYLKMFQIEKYFVFATCSKIENNVFIKEFFY